MARTYGNGKYTEAEKTAVMDKSMDGADLTNDELKIYWASSDNEVFVYGFGWCAADKAKEIASQVSDNADWLP